MASLKNIAMNTIILKSRIRIATALALMALFTSGLTSCKKEDDDDDPQEQVQENPTPTIEDGSGTLVAVKSSTTQSVPGFGDIEIPMNIAVAVFSDDANYTTFVNGGTVTCEGDELSIQSNNSYVFLPGVDNPEGIDFNGSIDWDVSGNGSIPAFTHTVGIGFPNVGDINSSSTVDISSDYTLSVPSLSGADSVIFMVGGVLETVPGNPTSHTFTAADLSGLSEGQSVAQVAAYKTESEVYGGETFYFVNETVETISVTLE